jgi:hypothetical protein
MKKNKLNETVNEIRDGFSSSLRAVCGRPSPTKRLVIVLIIGGVLSVVSVSALVRAIYDIGKRDAQRQFMEVQHIEQLKLKPSGDSILILRLNKNNDYEYDE